MSYDFRIAWLQPEMPASTWARVDTVADTPPLGVVSANAIKPNLRDRLLAGPTPWQISVSSDGSITLTDTSPTGGCEVLLDDFESEVGIAYGRPPSAFEAGWQALQVFAERGAVIHDPQLDRLIDPATDHDRCLESYLQLSQTLRSAAPSPTAASPAIGRLDRLPYLVRWLALWAVVLAALLLITRTGIDRSSPLLAITPLGLGWIVKMFWLDPARLRSIGWNERLTLLNLVPPYAPILQIQLFCFAPEET